MFEDLEKFINENKFVGAVIILLLGILLKVLDKKGINDSKITDFISKKVK